MGLKSSLGIQTLFSQDLHCSSHLWKVGWGACRDNHSRAGGHRDEAGTPGVLLIPGWAGKTLPNPSDTQQGTLPTLPEQIWAGLKKKKMVKGSPLGGLIPMSLPQTQQVTALLVLNGLFQPRNGQ